MSNLSLAVLTKKLAINNRLEHRNMLYVNFHTQSFLLFSRSFINLAIVFAVSYFDKFSAERKL